MINELFYCKNGERHNFCGGFCLNCKIRQEELNNKVVGRKKVSIKEYKIPAPKKNIHSELHAIVDELYQYFGVKGQFGVLLGVIKKIGKQKAFEILSELKMHKNKSIKLFMYLCKTK